MRDEVLVSGAFDDMRLKDFRLLDEAAKRGRVRVKLWSDEAIATTGAKPKCPLAERKYLLESIRFVDVVEVVHDPQPSPGLQPQVFPPLPVPLPVPLNPPGKKILVTGCYDWFYSGHVAFFEE